MIWILKNNKESPCKNKVYIFIYTSIYKIFTKGEEKMKRIVFFGYTLEVGRC